MVEVLAMLCMDPGRELPNRPREPGADVPPTAEVLAREAGREPENTSIFITYFLFAKRAPGKVGLTDFATFLCLLLLSLHPLIC